MLHCTLKNLYGYAMSKFLPASGFKWIYPKEFDLTKYTGNSSKGCVLEVDLRYPKELRELHNDYSYQLKIADLYNTPIGHVKKLVPNIFDKEKYVCHYENLGLGLKFKKIYIA